MSPLACITHSYVAVEVWKSRFANCSILSAVVLDFFFFFLIKTTIETTFFLIFHGPFLGVTCISLGHLCRIA